MRIPIEWLKEYISIEKSPREIAKAFTSLGLMLDKPIENGVLDLEHRMDRSDWLSILGCARDLTAFENLKLKYPKLHIEKGRTPTKNQVVDIKVECSDLVNRFNTKVFRNIKVKPSPEWLKNRLEAYGIPSINNIVDITNYVMVELGQPMHAQDLAKMRKPEIVIRRAKKGESITTFLGETIELDPNIFVLTQDNIPTVIGGMVGGIETGVDETTTDIVLDAGNYNQTNIRKNSRKLKIQNETVLRYDKFLHPKLTEIAIQRATYLILELAGGEYYENIDWYPKKTPLKNLELTYKRLKLLSCMDFLPKRIKEILIALEYRIIEENKTGLTLEVPYFRTDVEVEDDLIADILRINDYAKIPMQMIDSAPPREITPDIYKFEEKLRDVCVGLGLHEHITNPIVSRNTKAKNQVILENSLTSKKDALRTSIYETLSQVVTTYKKHKFTKVGLFEIGKIYLVEGEKDRFRSYKEERVLEVIYRNFALNTYENSNEVKRILSGIMQNLGIKNLVGEVKPDSFTLHTEKLMKISSYPKRITTEIDNYQTEDLSLVLHTNKAFGEAFEEIEKFDKNILKVEVTEEYTSKTLGENKKAILVRITHKAKGFSKIKKKLLDTLKEKHQIETR
jgi:phenylalanyl-tRNA synthetase beta chain